jgi:hypothetical protein
MRVQDRHVCPCHLLVSPLSPDLTTGQLGVAHTPPPPFHRDQAPPPPPAVLNYQTLSGLPKDLQNGK